MAKRCGTIKDPLMGASPRRWWVSSAQQPSLMYQSPAPTGHDSTGAVPFATSTVLTTNSAGAGAPWGRWIVPATKCSSRSGTAAPSGSVTSSQTTDVLDGAMGATVVGGGTSASRLVWMSWVRSAPSVAPVTDWITAWVVASRMSTRSSWNGSGRAFVRASSYARCVLPSVARTGAGVV